MDKADLRAIVLEALRTEPATNFPRVEDYVRGNAPDYRPVDNLTIREIMWELLVQGILAPGSNHTNIDFPWIHVTESGMECLGGDSIVPHDPERYLERLQQSIGQSLDDIVLAYARESLLTFRSGRFMAATVMLGVASERCVDLLIEAYSNAIADATEREEFDQSVQQAGRGVKRRFDVLRDNLLALTLPPELKDALDIQLFGIFTLIRYSRNDAGHPAGPMVDRDTAHANLLQFHLYCIRVYDLINHFSSTGL